MARPSKKAADKSELALRLGVPVTDILTRDQVAQLMMPPTTKNAITKNPDAFPPFISAGEKHIALYPRAWVQEYLKTGKVMDGQSRLLGRQPWPPELSSDEKIRAKRAHLADQLDIIPDARTMTQEQFERTASYRKSLIEGD